MNSFLNLIAQTQGPSDFALFIDKVARARLSHILYFVGALTLVHLALSVYRSKFAPHERYGGYTVAKIGCEIVDAIIYAGVLVFMVIRPFVMQTFFIPTPSMVDTLLVNDFIVANKAVYRYAEPKVGDIVVFKPPKRALLNPNENQDYIKRCVGVPGEVIEVRDGKLYRNGALANEPFVKSPMEWDFKLVKYSGVRKSWEGKYIPVDYYAQGPEDQANYNTSTAEEYAIGMNMVGGRPTFLAPSELSDEDRQVMKELRELPPAAIPPGHYMMMGDNRNHSFDSRGWGLVPRQSIIGRSEFIWLPFSRWRVTR